MKLFFSFLLTVLILSCNNNKSAGTASATDSAADQQSGAPLSSKTSGNCGNGLLFLKGATIHTSSYNAQGKETTKQVSTVTKVYQEGGMTVSDVEMKNTNASGADEKTMTASYKCDGKLFYVDLSGFVATDKSSSIESSGLLFPLDLSVGETLPDADYSITMNTGGKARKIASHIKERKVEAKESITIPAGTFDCYRISSIVEAQMDMPGMDEQSKKIMAETMKRMGKTKMVFWYAPGVTILKMELYMGDKLISKSEVTEITK